MIPCTYNLRWKYQTHLKCISFIFFLTAELRYTTGTIVIPYFSFTWLINKIQKNAHYKNLLLVGCKKYSLLLLKAQTSLSDTWRKIICSISLFFLAPPPTPHRNIEEDERAEEGWGQVALKLWSLQHYVVKSARPHARCWQLSCVDEDRTSNNHSQHCSQSKENKWEKESKGFFFF